MWGNSRIQQCRLLRGTLPFLVDLYMIVWLLWNKSVCSCLTKLLWQKKKMLVTILFRERTALTVAKCELVRNISLIVLEWAPLQFFFFFAQQTSHAKWKPKISTFGSLSRINPFRDVYTNSCSMNVPSGGWDFQDGGTTIARPASRWIWPKAIAPPHLVNLHFPFWYDFLAERYSIKYLICGFVLI